MTTKNEAGPRDLPTGGFLRYFFICLLPLRDILFRKKFTQRNPQSGADTFNRIDLELPRPPFGVPKGGGRYVAELRELIERHTKRAKEVYDSYLSLPSKNIREVHVQHGECQQKINELKEMKRNLYEKYLLRAITAEDYKKEKSVLNREAEKTEQILDSLYSQVTRIQADDGARDMLGQLEKEISSAEALTIELADTLISRVLVYPDNSLDIEWKVRAFSDDCFLNCARNRDQENEKSSIS